MDSPINYRQGLTPAELKRAYLDDGNSNPKGTRLYQEFEYEDPWTEPSIYRTQAMLLTVVDVARDGSVSLRLDRQAGIKGRSGTKKSNYTYTWNPATNTITSPSSDDLWRYHIDHLAFFFQQRPTVIENHNQA
jgi:hypothetical protein